MFILYTRTSVIFECYVRIFINKTVIEYIEQHMIKRSHFPYKKFNQNIRGKNC